MNESPKKKKKKAMTYVCDYKTGNVFYLSRVDLYKRTANTDLL